MHGMLSTHICIVLSVLNGFVDARTPEYYGLKVPFSVAGHGYFNFNKGTSASANTDSVSTCSSYKPPCESKVFCNSTLLKDAALSNVDLTGEYFGKLLIYTDHETIENYTRYKEDKGYTEEQVPPKEEVINFLKQHFDDTEDVTVVEPSDYKEETALMQRVSSEEYRDLLNYIQKYWKTTCGRVCSEEVEKNPDRRTLIYIPKPFCIPGGQFKELYYWDSYWIITGLFYSDLVDTAKAMIENFLYLVKKIGFIPNGTRVYYLNRSQPALLGSALKFYLDQTGDFSFIENNIEILEKEFQWFTKNRNVTVTKDGKKHFLFRYNTCATEPRPESFIADYEVAKNFTPGAAKDQIYSDLKSATESGFDFTTR